MVKNAKGFGLAYEEAKFLDDLKQSEDMPKYNIRAEDYDDNEVDTSNEEPLEVDASKALNDGDVAENVVADGEIEDVDKSILLSAIPYLTEEDMKILVVQYLFEQPDESKYGVWFNEKLNELFGEEYEPSQSMDEFKDERWQQITADFLQMKADDIKSMGFTLDADVLNETMEDLVKLSALNIENNKASRTDCIKMIKHRFSNIPEMAEATDVFDTSLGIFDLIVSNAQKVPSRIEFESNVQKMEDYYSSGVINREQMAMGYHNLAILTEKFAKSFGISKVNERYEYMRKSLSLTSDPRLIKTCFEYLPNKMSNKMLLVQEACDRALERKDIEKSQLFKVHMIYSKSLVDIDDVGYKTNLSGISYNEALYHYRQAFDLAVTNDVKAKVLRNIMKLQKGRDDKGYFKSRVQLAERFLHGKTKVRELIMMANENKQVELKKFLFESATNELIDTDNLSKEERSLLLKNVFNQLKPLYEKDNNLDKIKIIEDLENKYCDKSKDNQEVISRVSSKGRDYFERD